MPMPKTATYPSPGTRTGLRKATTPATATRSTDWEVIDDELSIFSPYAPDTPKATPRKRKQPSTSEIKGDWKHGSGTPESTPKKRKTASPKKKDEEKRLRQFRAHAPGTYLQKLERAQSQR
ncbi:MAG: hypothetical protein Q9224_005896 [Gallowayella concinna]